MVTAALGRHVVYRLHVVNTPIHIKLKKCEINYRLLVSIKPCKMYFGLVKVLTSETRFRFWSTSITSKMIIRIFSYPLLSLNPFIIWVSLSYCDFFSFLFLACGPLYLIRIECMSMGGTLSLGYMCNLYFLSLGLNPEPSKHSIMS